MDLMILVDDLLFGEGERDCRFDCSARIEVMDSDNGRNFGFWCLRGLALMGENEGGVRFVSEAGRIVPDDVALWVSIGEGFEGFRGVGSS